MLFHQNAGEGLTHLVEEMQKTYKPKKGRRFHHSNITYEVSRPVLRDNLLEFEISSKIPQDELKDPKQMQKYFEGIKKSIGVRKENLVSIEMENIVWDSNKENEKERDYVKLLYRYPLDDLFNDKEVAKEYELIKANKSKRKIPEALGTFTLQGRIVLAFVQEKIQELGRNNLETLIKANDKIRSSLKN